MMMLIPYAGQETAPKPGTFEARCERAYTRFNIGQSTMTIAKMMNVSEATALKYVTIGRCYYLGLESPYG